MNVAPEGSPGPRRKLGFPDEETLPLVLRVGIFALIGVGVLLVLLAWAILTS